MALWSLCVFTYLFSTTLSGDICSLANECVGQELIESVTIAIGGYKAAAGPSTSFTGVDANFNGGYAADSIASTTASRNVWCRGTSSCSNTSITMQSTASLMCNAANTCSYSTIISTVNGVMHCRGDQSCGQSDITAMGTIGAHGAYALYRATIQGSTTSEMTVQLYGANAGYGARVTCGKACTILCRTFTACYNLYLDCNGAYPCGLLLYAQRNIRPVQNISQFDPEPTIAHNEDTCNTAPHSLTYDDTREYAISTNTADIVIDDEHALCCRGYAACEYKERIYYELVTNQSVICSGFEACLGVSQYMDTHYGMLFCEGMVSCSKSKIRNTRRVYCLGSEACTHTVMSGIRYLLCSAYHACSDTNIIINGTDIDAYFIGFLSGMSVQMTCSVGDRCNIKCTGYRSCDDMVVTCDGVCDIECDSATLCPDVTTLNPTESPTRNPTQNTIEPTRNPSVPSQNPLFLNEEEVTGVLTTSDQWINPTHQEVHGSADIMSLTTLIGVIATSTCLVCSLCVCIWHGRRHKAQHATKDITNTMVGKVVGQTIASNVVDATNNTTQVDMIHTGVNTLEADVMHNVEEVQDSNIYPW
eukprot:450336_1